MDTPKLNHLLDVDGIESIDGFVTLPVETIEVIESLLPNLDKQEEQEDSPKLSEASIELLKELGVSDTSKSFKVPFELVEKLEKEQRMEIFPKGTSINLGKVDLSLSQINHLTELLG